MLVNAPPGIRAKLAPLPAGAKIPADGLGDLDAVSLVAMDERWSAMRFRPGASVGRSR